MDIGVGLLSLANLTADDVPLTIVMSGIVVVIALSAFLRIRLVRPGHYLVVVDHVQGRYLTHSSGIRFLWWWQAAVQNPWDHHLEWPCTGKQIEIDPASVSVLCSLNETGGTARGSCDVRMVLSVKASLLNASSDGARIRLPCYHVLRLPIFYVPS